MCRLLRNATHQAHYDCHGWARLSHLDEAEIGKLNEGFAAIKNRLPKGFGTTYTMDDPDVKSIATLLIKLILQTSSAGYLLIAECYRIPLSRRAIRGFHPTRIKTGALLRRSMEWFHLLSGVHLWMCLPEIEI